MDKRHKTKWEKNMKILLICLMFSLPLLAGLAIWLLETKTRFSP